jgi:toxin HigB-1
MEVRFLTARLKKICESSAERKKRFGEPAASKLKNRLDDMDAAQCLEDMRNLPGHWEELTGNRKGQFSCRLAGGAPPHRQAQTPATAYQTRRRA